MTPKSENDRDRLGWWAALALFLVLSALVVVRALVVDAKIGTYIACPGCFHLDVLLADLILFSALASLLLLASCSRRRMLARGLHLVWGAVVLVFAADVIVFALFNSRLLMTDVALFFSEGSAVWNQFASGLGGAFWAVMVLLAFVALFGFLWWQPVVATRRFRLAMSFVLVASLAGSAVFKGAPYVNDWAVENVFVANMSTPSRNRYAPETEARILADEPATSQWRAETPPARGRNVILVLLESWSPWHSRLFGGFENWTPNLDAAARRGLRFDAFHSIGFSTDKGLVGILGGQHLWAPFLHWFETPPFHSMWGLEGTLPQAFNLADYHTAFLTSGPLTLYRKGEWMFDIGFDEVEGNESRFYEGWKRFAFGAASDRALYQRAMHWMVAANGPWLLVLETVSTHQPYRDPESRERSLELVMKYADREFGVFLEQLDTSGFFENGILVVISDHRSMTPMSRRELDTWGAAAYSRVPGFVIGAGFEPDSVDASVYSQSDLAPSFEWWATGEATLGPFDAIMLDPAFDTEKCAFHERSDRRGVMEVICDEGRGQIILDGDHTRFVGRTDLSQARQEQALKHIARQRIEAWQRHLATED